MATPRILLAELFLVCACAASAQLISGVDPNYGAGGLYTWDHGGQWTSSVKHVFHRPDGRTVVVGASVNVLSETGKPYVALLRPDGTPDLGFGRHGACDYEPYINTGQWYSRFVTAAMQSDGKVLMVLLDPGFGSQQLVRVQADGYADASFGVNGAVILPLGSVQEIAVQADDGILLIGDDGNGHHCVRRRLSTGAVDSAFGVGGAFVSSVSGGFDRVELLQSGKILLAGVGLARLNSDGTLDTSFGTGGWSALPFFNAYATRDLAEQPDGRVLVCTMSQIRRLLTDGNTFDPVFPFNAPTFSGAMKLAAASDGSWYYYYNDLWRIDANDQVDAAFGSFGTVDLIEGTTVGFDLLGDSEIEISGQVLAGDPQHFDVVLERRDLTGSLVNSWGRNGRMELNGNGAGENVDRLAVANDGHLWVVGRSYQGPPMLARFLPDGSPDLDYGYSGAEYPVTTSANCIGARIDGSALVGGTEQAGLSATAWVQRTLPDGGFDPAWSIGIPVTGTANDYQRCADLVVLPDDRMAMLINMSNINDANGWNSAVVMLDANGNPDPAFGIGGQVIVSGTGPSFMSGIALLPNGSLLCAGTVQVNGISELFAYALDQSGQPLSGFGSNGTTSIPVQSDFAYNTVGRPVAAPDGSFYLLYSNGAQSWVSHVLANGTLDLAFANGSYEIDPAWTGSGMGLMSNGELLVSCYEYFGTMPILKLDATGALVQSFGTNGVYTVSDTANVLFGNSVVTVLPGDTVLIAGDLRNRTFWDNGGIDAFLFRFEPDFNVGAQAQPLSNGLTCYPSPSLGTVSVKMRDAMDVAEVFLQDVTGRRIPIVVERRSESLLLSMRPDAPNGTYVLSLITPDGARSSKLMLQR